LLTRFLALFGMRIALVHEQLIRFGGAERVLQALHELFPSAPIYTLLFDERMREFFPGADIRPSFLSSVSRFIPHRFLLPLFPSAVEGLDLRDFDIVLSSSSAFAKGIITRPKTVHICYCHSPTRFLWDWTHEYLFANRIPRILHIPARIVLHMARLWDQHAAGRVDIYIANSRYTADRIKKYYRKDSKVIYPPVTMGGRGYGTRDRDDSANPNPYSLTPSPSFIIVSQLAAHKRIDLAVEAFVKLGLPLTIIGEGPERRRLEHLAASNIRFLGWQPEPKMKDEIRRAHAFVFSGEDDFGLAPLEAMVLGKPVLAYKGGGALEWLREGACGEFFEDRTPGSLADGIRRMLEGMKAGRYDPKTIRKQAAKFSPKLFTQKIRTVVEKAALGL